MAFPTTSKLSLTKKLVLPTSLVMALVFLLLSQRIIFMVSQTLDANLEKRVDRFVSFVQSASASLVYNLDNQSLKFFVDEAKKDSDFVYMIFTDVNEKPLWEENLPSIPNEVKIISKDIYSPKNPDDVIGKIKLAYSFESTHKLVSSLVYSIAMSLTIGFLLQLALVYFVSQKVSQNISGTSYGLGHSVQRLNSSSTDIRDTSVRLESVSNDQASAIQETVATLNEITSMVNRSVEHVETSSQKSNLSFRISVEANQSVSHMREALEGIKGEIEQFGLEVKNSNQQISMIGGIISDIIQKTNVINDIVFQTKLLSFNASVEAARAGEHGKGFSVVAEEVGNLARMSGKASQEISHKLAQSQNEVNKIILSTTENMQRLIDRSNAKVKEGVQLADDCTSILKEAVRHADEVKSNLGEVNAAAKEQATGIHNISTAMNQLDATTHLQADIAQKLSAMSLSLHKQGSEIKRAVDALELEVKGGRRQVPVQEPVVEIADEEEDDIDYKIAS